MKWSTKSGVFSILIGLLLSAGGCESQSQPGDLAQMETNNGVQVGNVGSENAEFAIVSGRGLPHCYVGMSVEKLGAQWEIPPEPEIASSVRCDSVNGLEAEFDSGRLTMIFFYFEDSRTAPFQGRTDKGIGKESTIGDVIDNYGVPSYVDMINDSTKNESTVCLYYAEEGIQFHFVKARLVNIAVLAPRSDFNYDEVRRIGGGGMIYVRNPQLSNEDHEAQRLKARLEELSRN